MAKIQDSFKHALLFIATCFEKYRFRSWIQTIGPLIIHLKTLLLLVSKVNIIHTI